MEVDPEREAFLAELDRVAQDLEKVRFPSKAAAALSFPLFLAGVQVAPLFIRAQP